MQQHAALGRGQRAQVSREFHDRVFANLVLHVVDGGGGRRRRGWREWCAVLQDSADYGSHQHRQ